MTGPLIKNSTRSDAIVSTNRDEFGEQLSSASMGQSIEVEIAIAEQLRVGEKLTSERTLLQSGHSRVVSFGSSSMPVDDGTAVDPYTSSSIDRAPAVGEPIVSKSSAAAPGRTVISYSSAPS